MCVIHVKDGAAPRLIHRPLALVQGLGVTIQEHTHPTDSGAAEMLGSWGPAKHWVTSFVNLVKSRAQKL